MMLLEESKRGFDSLQPHVFLVKKDNHGFDWPILFTPPAWKMHPLTRRDWPP